MLTANQKLAQSLELLHAVQQDGIVRSADLTRTHRERLIKSGFLEEVIKGWLIVSNPSIPDGGSTAWYASFWPFVTRYLSERFGDAYCLSPEASIKRHVGSGVVPNQVIVMTTGGGNQLLNLSFGTSLLTYQDKVNFPKDRVQQENLWLMDLPAAVCRVQPAFFHTSAEDMELALRMIRDPAPLLRSLLEGGNAVIAGRLAGAYDFLGEPRIASQIKDTMTAAGHSVRITNPFDRPKPLLGARVVSPHAARIQLLWAAMRLTVLDIFPPAPGLPSNGQKYLAAVDERYASDAYNSLSIEGYQVSPQLIEQVRSGDWNPAGSEADSRQLDALAARGYYQAFQAVEKSLREIMGGLSAGEVATRDHQAWYREMFSPAVQVGILKPADLAGYRNNRVYLRGSRHVPPAPEAVLDCMEALFDLIRDEAEPSARAVLGHFLFGYVHPYPDGNGRLARFLMNAMLASGGYPWTVVRQGRRQQYLDALEIASTENDIAPFAEFLKAEMQAEAD